MVRANTAPVVLMVAVAWLACGRSHAPSAIGDAGVDAAWPVDAGQYTFAVGAGPGCFIKLPGVYIEINGERVDGVVDSFPDFEAAVGRTYVVESKYGDEVVDRVVVQPGFCAQPDFCSRPPWLVEAIDYVLLEGGRLAFASAQCNSCAADGFCDGIDCHAVLQWGCGDPARSRCGMLNVLGDPQLSYITCVPDSQVAVGQACTFGPSGLDTGYDDCAAGAVCIDGSCRAFCAPSLPCVAGTCTYGRPGFPANSHRTGYCAR